MTEQLFRGVSIEALRRMIVYAREEAERLRVMDVALLLELAESAVLAFSPPALGPSIPSMLDAGRIEH